MTGLLDLERVALDGARELARAPSQEDGKSTLGRAPAARHRVDPHRPARRAHPGHHGARRVGRRPGPRAAHRRPARRARAGHHHRRGVPVLRHRGPSFVLADCPGHVQYTRNTVTDASTAELAVVLVDARRGVLEQTRRHLAVLAFLRVPHVVLAVNEMDLVDFDEAVFRRNGAEVAAAAAALGVPAVVSVPVSALRGDNVVARSADPPWYGGPTLLGHLEAVPVGRAALGEPVRFPVQAVIRPRTPAHPDYRGLAERPLRPGARVLVKHGTRTVRGLVAALTARLDLDTLTRTAPPAALELNEIGGAAVRLAEPLVVDPYATHRHTGRFLVVDRGDGATLAAGLVAGGSR